MKNKNLIIKLGKFMDVDITEYEDYYVFTPPATDLIPIMIEYNPFENPAQMNDFIEHPDVMMDIKPTYLNSWNCEVWRINKFLAKATDKHRPTAINKCAAAFFGETYEE